jgi:hypothetical protein
MTTLLLLVVLAGGPAKAAPAPEEQWCHVYPKRCDEACKKAHNAATAACPKELQAFNAALKDKEKATALGKCLVACRPPGAKTMCVGPEDQAGCDCETGCYKKHMADALDVAKAAGACYHKAVAPACQ